MNVTVFTTPSCVQCEMTKKVLTKDKVEFTVVDLSTDQEAMEKVKALGYASAPVVIAGDTHWSGFQHSRLKTLATIFHTDMATQPKEHAVA